MANRLVLSIRLHDRYHGMALGAPEWPPAPARVFQALVAAAGKGFGLPEDATSALQWLEDLAPPEIAAPRSRLAQRVDLFVPNNDADSLQDARDVSSLRTKKVVHPRIVEKDEPLRYAWRIDGDPDGAAVIVGIAEHLYQLGRGVDMAWATGEVLEEAEWQAILAQHRGTIHRPSRKTSDRSLACPTPGSLQSLEQRFHARRLTEIDGDMQFTNAPKARFATVSYGDAHRRYVFEMRDSGSPDALWPWPLRRVVSLTERLRDGAAARLRAALPELGGDIERAIIGRKVNGEHAAAIEDRVRIVAMPSIGHEHADLGIRRVLVEVPGNCLLSHGDVAWAFSGLGDEGFESGPHSNFVLVAANDASMADRYSGTSLLWRSITPVALPEAAGRRRIEPARQRLDPKPAAERTGEEQRAIEAVRTALRHAGVRATPVMIRVQREPLQSRGIRAEAFGENTRFAKERLWHVEVRFDLPAHGPLVIGDGRFLGLGVLAPSDSGTGVLAVRVDGTSVPPHAVTFLVKAMRRALMARIQATIGKGKELDAFFTGHALDGSPARTTESNHIAVQWEPDSQCLLVIAPNVLDHRTATRRERVSFQVVEEAVAGMTELVAGRAGRFQVLSITPSAGDAVFGVGRTWVSVSPYTVTRHSKRLSAVEVAQLDVEAECVRRGMPAPKVTVLSTRAIPGVGLTADLRLDFQVALVGPVAIGRTRYVGGGLFRPI